ncbi:Sex determination protein tasselseed-2 [Dichanthelium oligosanthes]|uniref:Sex determination protein tasselseed-2 n=1 Tax=Dichanthelium oligosanthes TaxID=888268 RepID=A0A1E5UNK7_9POAL|nr:Sex determination protein tasselseed-2 [Dichanthelium oligosanthes]
MHASLASYAAAAMPTLDLRPEMGHAHQPAMSPSHHGWDGNGAAVAPTPMPKRLDGKVAIVTGGARGIGEAIVRVFVKHGARVVIADIDDAVGEALASALGPQVSFVRCDVSVEEDVRRAVDWALSRHGGRLDVYCNNAGVLGRQTRAAKSILSFDAGEFDRVLRVNALGTALGMKHAALAMAPRRAGSIVSVASVAGVLGGLGPHAYTASKHAIVGLTKNAACELGAHGIRVNCVSPFGVATPMLINAWRQGHDDAAAGDDDLDIDIDIDIAVPSDEEVEKMEEVVRGFATLKGATLRPRDIAEAVLFLASDESRYISGHNLVVDGGVTTSRNLIGL